jgi:TonB family protein
MRFLLTLTLAVLFAGAQAYAQDSVLSQGTQDSAAPKHIRVGGNVSSAKLLNRVQPVYPPLARQTRISGTVRLHAIVAKDGAIQSQEVISGHPLLQQAALDAVHQWRYEPTLLNGEPVEVDTTIDVIFALNQDAPGPAQAGNIPIAPQLRADILHLFEVTHFKENAATGGRRVFESLRPALMASLPVTPSRDRITDAYVDKLLALLQSDSYMDRVIAIYGKYFSDEDVKGLVEFYQTPTGQHFNSVMPQFLGDLNQIGQQLALENLPGIFQQLCKEFPELQDDARFCKEPDPHQKSLLLTPTPPAPRAF